MSQSVFCCSQDTPSECNSNLDVAFGVDLCDLVCSKHIEMRPAGHKGL